MSSRSYTSSNETPVEETFDKQTKEQNTPHEYYRDEESSITLNLPEQKNFLLPNAKGMAERMLRSADADAI